MSIVDDPAMREVVQDFSKEALELFDQLEEILTRIEEDIANNYTQLEEFGQIIDRVMGAAKSLKIDEIANFCELGKLIGYKAGQSKDLKLNSVVVAILFDAVDLLKKMTNKLVSGNNQLLKDLNTKAFATRLRWLSDKFKHIERSSCDVDEEDIDNEKMTQESIDDLIDSLGL